MHETMLLLLLAIQQPNYSAFETRIKIRQQTNEAIAHMVSDWASEQRIQSAVGEFLDSIEPQLKHELKGDQLALVRVRVFNDAFGNEVAVRVEFNGIGANIPEILADIDQKGGVGESSPSGFHADPESSFFIVIRRTLTGFSEEKTFPGISEGQVKGIIERYTSEEKAKQAETRKAVELASGNRKSAGSDRDYYKELNVTRVNGKIVVDLPKERIGNRDFPSQRIEIQDGNIIKSTPN
jgi:hypothetical protein